MRILFLFSITLVLSACTGLPSGVQPVTEFKLNKYLGKWYEIARLDHSFERGLNYVTATYSLRKDGGIRVINKGFSQTDGKRVAVLDIDFGRPCPKSTPFFDSHYSLGRPRHLASASALK